jgi:murein DD-endopeptidase MepM/ murein hydrolase activator NlpD
MLRYSGLVIFLYKVATVRRSFLLLLFVFLFALAPWGTLGATPVATSLGVQSFLEQQPGPLKAFREEKRSAAAIIESSSFYYGLSPRLSLTLLETISSLLSDPVPAAERLSQPFGPAGPTGFAAQIDWVSRELRAGLGPYDSPPTVRFSDGTTLTLTLQQAPEGVAVQRFLSQGRSSAEWRVLVERFGTLFQTYFNNELVTLPTPVVPGAASSDFTLQQPWPATVRAVHLAYFDHAYPTVDSGEDGNQYVVNYLGAGGVQYDGHDGHDYYFPDQPVGTPILAAAAGIAHARTHRGYGVVIQHPGGYETVYWHLDGFAPIFQNRIDSNQGVWVEAGAFIGTSGRTGFVQGTPHLHFEVRKDGRQVDPYGWSGPGADPCLSYAGCGVSTWLWDNSLSGQFNFTRPDSSAQPLDTKPPLGTLTINPPSGLLFHVPFEGHPLQHVGSGFPVVDGSLSYKVGQQGQAFQSTSQGSVSYPIAGNLVLEAGTLSMWVEIPERYLANTTERHYLFATSATPNDPERVYSGTLALRRDRLGPDGEAQWSFWSEGPGGRDLLAVPDELAPGWHHMALTWEQSTGTKQLFIDGQQVAEIAGASLPSLVGAEFHLGQFTYNSSPAGTSIDEVAIYDRVLLPGEVAALSRVATEAAGAIITSEQELYLDTNAIDTAGGIVAVQLGRDGQFDAPQPYYDAYSWRLPAEPGTYELAARYVDRAGNTTTITQSVVLTPPATPQASVIRNTTRGVYIRLRSEAVGSCRNYDATCLAQNGESLLEVQFSEQPDFADAVWKEVKPVRYWRWQGEFNQVLYARFRDPAGTISEPVQLVRDSRVIYLPLIADE